MSRFDIIPLEIIQHIMSFMKIVEKEYFTKAYMQYYDIFKKEKTKFLFENYHLKYEPLIKIGVEKFINYNLLCVGDIMTKKIYLINSFPEIFRDIFIDINTPIIHYTSYYKRSLENYSVTEKIQYNRCFGIINNRKYIFLKIKDTDEFISIRESVNSKKWFCVIGDSIDLLISRKYVDFALLEKIVEMI